MKDEKRRDTFVPQEQGTPTFLAWVARHAVGIKPSPLAGGRFHAQPVELNSAAASSGALSPVARHSVMPHNNHWGEM